YYQPNYYNNTTCSYGYYMSAGTCYPNTYNTYQPTYYQQPTYVQPTQTTFYTPPTQTTRTIVQTVQVPSPTPAPATTLVVNRNDSLQILNIKISSDGAGNVITSWDTSAPAYGEVVFGYTSQPGNRTSYNYDSTTGRLPGVAFHQEVSLGQLELNRVHYIRVLAVTPDGVSAVSPEMTFIPLPGGQI